MIKINTLKSVDVLNTFLLILSVLLAYLLPFELFLLSYAILGPLHYLTEIHWIQEKSYFVKEKYWLPVCMIMAVLISLPPLLKLEWIKSLTDGSVIVQVVKDVQEYSNIFTYVCLLLAIVFIAVHKKMYQLVFIVIGIFLGIVIIKERSFNVLFGVLIPTIIHVYLFTLLFMWYGSLKGKSKIGYLNVVLLSMIPIFILFLPYEFFANSIKDFIRSIYVENKFYILNATLSKLFSFSDGKTFDFSDLTTQKIQMLISFAYTYHYLNWFSKTKIIGWGKNLNKNRLILVLFIWIISVGLFFIDYQLGVILLLFLSFMHVFLEFPINVISIKGIYSFYKQRLLK